MFEHSITKYNSLHFQSDFNFRLFMLEAYGIKVTIHVAVTRDRDKHLKFIIYKREGIGK